MAHSQQQTTPTWTNLDDSRPPPVEEHPGSSPSASAGANELLTPVSTLDEPVRETVMRDVRAVGVKLKAVMMPVDRSRPFGYVRVLQENNMETSDEQRNVLNQLRDWDLWGPLFICLALAIILSTRAPAKQTSHVFTTVFVVMWCGSLVVTVNAQLLGASISVFQSVCVLGYCVFPLTCSALLLSLLRYTPLGGMLWLDLTLLAVGLLWATRVSTIFIGQFVRRDRRLLAVYPVFFFYLLIGWLILLF